MTEAVAAYTTICFATAYRTDVLTGTSTASGISTKPTESRDGKLTTSTVYITHVHPVTACRSPIRNCVDSPESKDCPPEYRDSSGLRYYLSAAAATRPMTSLAAAATESSTNPAIRSGATEDKYVSTITTVIYATEIHTATVSYTSVSGSPTEESTTTYLSTVTVPMTKTLYVSGATASASGFAASQPSVSERGISTDSQGQQQSGASYESTIPEGRKAGSTAVGVSAESEEKSQSGTGYPPLAGTIAGATGGQGSGAIYSTSNYQFSSIASIVVSSWSNHQTGVVRTSATSPARYQARWSTGSAFNCVFPLPDT
ncbi:uncharacterized protein BO97DRAFT_448770 [Aspergillus homomorphus CBS 101889]|uniref:Uncharacterized protein n=1 Tax=Aspergillus homomorphus (strain CBS 101889) TaxID=1450537 RepID=A0A395I7H2_ASPHC|nr:hypothetical protein BO97DRAFT_448770 [Aspergillus homomorphus CBS 101889]RAL14164.1 hypothetical protein BO97DRAFT_448770 [Aspergillus homomorphus CBS 101889]